MKNVDFEELIERAILLSIVVSILFTIIMAIIKTGGFVICGQ